MKTKIFLKKNKNEIFRYLSFWKLFLASVLVFSIVSVILMRYFPIHTLRKQNEIIDKAQDSEMALPTAMTIFNRSMVNLEMKLEL